MTRGDEKVAGCLPRQTAVPGLVIVTLATAGAFTLSRAIDGLPPFIAAVLAGAALTNAGIVGAAAQPGFAFAGKHLLRIGVALLGFRLSAGQIMSLGGPTLLLVLAVVTVTFLGTQWLGRRLEVSSTLSLLIATGFAICGASAIAAMQGVTRAEEEEVAFAIGLVTLFGTLAIVAMPLLQGPLGLSSQAFGQWAGASVHDVGQVVATADTAGPTALEAAVVVKLTRVVLLAPLVVAVSVMGRWGSQRSAVAVRERMPLLPLFLIAFLVAVGIRSGGWLPPVALGWIHTAETTVLMSAMVGLGAGVNFADLRALGGRPLLLGLLSWVVIAAVAYGGVLVVVR